MIENYYQTKSDITITCLDCRAEFVWTVAEQDYYAKTKVIINGIEKSLDKPKRCKDCRERRRADMKARHNEY